MEIKSKSVTPPNILLITTDQQHHDYIGLKGTKGLETPNLDRLAKNGILFDRAYCPSPLCTPTRLSLLTGLYPSIHGGHSIGVSTEINTTTIPQILSESGYKTALFGKTHFVARENEASHIAGIPKPQADFWRSFNGPYLGFDFVQTSSGHTIQCTPDMHYRVFLEDSGIDYKQYFPMGTEEYSVHTCGRWELPEELHDTAWIGSLTEKFINNQKDTGSPWFCWTSFQDPHPPFVCPEPWFSSVNIDEIIPYEGIKNGEFDDRPAFYNEIMSKQRSWFDDGHGTPCCFHFPQWDSQIKTAIQSVYGMINFIDYRIGKIVQTLNDTKQLDNTIIVFTSDHGDMMGHHGLWGKGLPAYEDQQRVPLIISAPHLIKKPAFNYSPTSLIDLPITFLKLSGAKVPLGMQGKDLSPILKGKSDSVQDGVIIESQCTAKIYQQTFITHEHKLVVYRDFDEGELYDLQKDPNQYRNLWHLPEFISLKMDLMHRFLQANMTKEGVKPPRTSFA